MSGREIINYGKVAVFKDAVVAISYELHGQDGHDATEPRGVVALHLTSGGKVNIETQDPAGHANAWIGLVGFDQ